MSKVPSVTFHGGVGSPTGSNFLLETEGAKILIDCGLRQGAAACGSVNYEPFTYNPSEIDAVVITHAHLDHIGRLPRLVHKGFHKQILSTPPTKDIAEYVFDDGIAIMRHELRDSGKEPLYEKKDAKQTLSQWKTVPYHETFNIGDVKIELYDAGHILGSAVVVCSLPNGKRLAFTGDLGNSPTPLLRNTEKLSKIDYLVTESVYGDRNHEPVESRREKLKLVISSVIERRGTLMIPAFSIERTQVLLSEINDLVEGEEIRSVPIFLDSPLAIEVTSVYQKYSDYFNDGTKARILSGDDVFSFPKLEFTRSVADSKEIARVPDPKIIIAGSGMSHAGRIRHHEKRYLQNPNNTLLIVGFQAPGSLGRQLQEGAKYVEIFGSRIPVRAKVESVQGYSAHKDSEGLLEFVDATSNTLKKVFVVLGEPRASQFLTQRLRDYLDVDAVVPKLGQTVELI